MIVHVGTDGAVDVRDADDFRRFKIAVDLAADALADVRETLAGFAVLDSPGQAWVSADALRRIAGRENDQAWCRSLDAMIDKARPHGWIRDNPLMIAAHVEWKDGK